MSNAVSIRPRVVVLAGPNGAGKSTAAARLLMGVLKVDTYLNGDDIARDLEGVSGSAADLQASRLMLAQITTLAAYGRSFAFETTLAGRSTPKRLRRLQGVGYRSHVLFLWLPSPQMAIDRVRSRHLIGGHDVPVDTIVRRYRAGLIHFRTLLRPIADNWRVYDNSGAKPRLIAFGRRMTKERIKDAQAWQRFLAGSDGADDPPDR